VIENSEDKIVTIFGGSKCKHDSEEYLQALDLGHRLAEAGFTICTGGYLGVMEAASRGAREAGGRVFGIVMNQFKSEPNRYLTTRSRQIIFTNACKISSRDRSALSHFAEAWEPSPRYLSSGTSFKLACSIGVRSFSLAIAGAMS
jgi:hypothetical protein